MIINSSNGLTLELILFAIVFIVNNCTTKQKLQVVEDYYVYDQNKENTKLLSEERITI